jgi:2,5-furandicarboxylate decarboxylase 1
MEASHDLILVPGARGHEYVRIGQNGIRTKLGIDATVPFADRDRFMRCAFTDVSLDPKAFVFDSDRVRRAIGQ